MGRPTGSTNKPGSQKPGPKPAVDPKQKRIDNFYPKASEILQIASIDNTQVAVQTDQNPCSSVQTQTTSSCATASVQVYIRQNKQYANQQEFIADTKKEIGKAIKHSGGKIKGTYPFDDFWIHPQNPTFNSPIKPESFYLKPLFIWIPEFQFRSALPEGQIPCPTCKISKSVISNGWSDPRNVVLKENCCSLLGFRYLCKSCNTSFHSWNPEVLPLLPEMVKSQFPFLLTHRSGIELYLVRTALDDLLHGKGFAAIQENIKQNHLDLFHRLELQYYSAVQLSSKTLVKSDPLYFGEFDDPDKYNGFVPTEHYLSNVWEHYFYERIVIDISGEPVTRELYLHRHQQMIDGKVWCGDASHKIAKLTVVKPKRSSEFMADSVASNPIHGIFTMLNEYEQIIWQKPMKTRSLRELKDDLKQLLTSRYLRSGFELPELMFTDECCDDRLVLDEILDEIAHDTGKEIVLTTDSSRKLESNSVAQIDLLTLPVLPMVIEKHDQAIIAVGEIRNKIEGLPLKVIGLDLEWECSFNQDNNIPACLQIAIQDGATYLFRVLIGKEKNLFAPLKDLLEDHEILKVGVNIKGDATRFENGFDTKIANCKDLAVYARELHLIGRKQGSLRKLLNIFVSKDISKDTNLRLSAWASKGPLSNNAVLYACLDAYASILVFLKLHEIGNSSKSLSSDEEVILLNRSRKRIVATAIYLKPYKDGKSEVKLTKVMSKNAKSMAGKDTGSIVYWKTNQLRPNIHLDVPSETSATGRSETKLDVFHAMNRIVRTLKIKHGAFPSFISRLKDAFFIVNEEDLALVKDVARKNGIEEKDLNSWIDRKWGKVTENCRRRVPGPDLLLERVCEVFELFRHIKDSKTDELLLRPATWKAFENLKTHIRGGCLSDPENLKLYFKVGTGKYGLPKYRCIRGTNSNEGYHRHVRRLLGRYAASPKLLHSILMEFNYRWNVRSSVRNRGMDSCVAGFYEQSVLEKIQKITDKMFNDELYKDWVPISEYEDTLERTGLQRSLLNDLADITIDVEDSEDDHNYSKSQRFMGLLDGVVIPFGPVQGKDEKAKFAKELARFRTAPDERGQTIDFSRWCISWNQCVTELEEGESSLILFRKNVSHLESYYKQQFEQSNELCTMINLGNDHGTLKKRLRQPDNLGLEARTMMIRQKTSIEPINFSQESEAVPVVEPLITLPQRVQDQKPVQCKICGHNKRSVYYKALHTGRGGICQVPPEGLRKLCNCKQNPKKGSLPDSPHFHPCDCTNCAQ